MVGRETRKPSPIRTASSFGARNTEEWANPMKRLVAEWLWRPAVLCVLGLIAWELLALRADIAQPADDQAVTTASDDARDSVEAIRDDIASLARKVRPT
jgi:hypothetical protein